MSILSHTVDRIRKKFFPVPASPRILDLNARYDLETEAIIRQLPPDANCIDVGAHSGDILSVMLETAPRGRHFAFEPIPHLFQDLQKKYGAVCQVYPFALSDASGETEFNYVTTNPAYSGIRKRKYDRDHEEVSLIRVPLKRMDEVILPEIPVHFIKIDVEGAEFEVIRGAGKIISAWHPLIIYEQGLGASDIYGTDPGVFFDYLTSHGYRISLMEYYLLNKEPLTREEYCQHFYKAYNFYFIAYPAIS